MDHFYETVDGLFNFRDIYDIAVAAAADGAVFVEIGSWYGRSAAYMAVEIANSGKQIAFHCLETWRGSEDLPWMTPHLASTGGSAYPDFMENMQRGGVSHIVRPNLLPSVEAAAMFSDESVDFVFVDGTSDFESVRNHVQAWLPKLKQNGLMAGDDASWPGVLIGVREAIPFQDVKTINDGANWLYRKHRPEPGHWSTTGPHADASDYFAYIPYVNRADLLDRAVTSVRDLWSSLVVIDQSAEGLRASDHAWMTSIAGVYRAPRGSMTFSQMMNWAQAEAIARGAEYLVFMHNDAECADGVTSKALDRARSSPRAGAIFTFYDAFAVFRVEAIRSVGIWDETFQWYFADNDYYRRMQLRGWEEVSIGGEGVTHHGSQTLKSDARVSAEVRANWRWHKDHYRHKWGGSPGQERYKLPYGGKH